MASKKLFNKLRYSKDTVDFFVESSLSLAVEVQKNVSLDSTIIFLWSIRLRGAQDRFSFSQSVRLENASMYIVKSMS